MENKPGRIIWHHTADLQYLPQADKVNSYHRSLNYPVSSLGFYGGYHVLIEKDGSTFRYRNDNEIGAHDKGENFNTLGLAMAGNFDVEMPTWKQEEALAKVVEEWMEKWLIPFSRIEPHRIGDATSCPGKLLSDNWAKIIYIKHKLSWLQRILLKLLERLNTKLY